MTVASPGQFIVHTFVDFVADMDNVGPREMQALNAAAFVADVSFAYTVAELLVGSQIGTSFGQLSVSSRMYLVSLVNPITWAAAGTLAVSMGYSRVGEKVGGFAAPVSSGMGLTPSQGFGTWPRSWSDLNPFN